MKLKHTEIVERDATLFHCRVSPSFMKLLINEARQAYKQYLQWRDMHHAATAAQYHAKCTALVELLEQLDIFHVGFGTGMEKNKCNELLVRLKSFEKVYDKIALDPKDFDFSKQVPDWS